MVRHGESRWNLCDRFTGWVDVPLSEHGVKEAQLCAIHCKDYDFTAAFTSNLSRAQETLLIILSLQDRTAILQHAENVRYRHWTKLSNRCGAGDLPVFTSAVMNERFYGDLQGVEKGAAERQFGKEKVFAWRRGFFDRPPGGETLKETFDRVHPYFSRNILPRVRRGEDILVAGHGNTLRAIVKHLEKFKDGEVLFLDLPQGQPLVYEYKHGKFVHTTGEFAFDRPLR